MTTTGEEEAAGRRVLEALRAFNAAVKAAGQLGIFVEIDEIRTIGARNPEWLVTKMEKRETVAVSGKHVDSSGSAT